MASSVSLIQMLASGMVTSAGVPVASGKVTFFLPGTLTPVSVYSDIAAATPISPPLTLTAGGNGVAYTKVPTRMIVKDSTSTTTYYDGLVNIERAEQLYIQSAAINGGTETTLQTWLDAYSTSFGGTAGLWKIKIASSATERNLVDVINDVFVSVKSFGATGGGAVDDRAAIQATIDYVGTLGGGTVYFPPGTAAAAAVYLCSTALTFPASAPIVLRGASNLASILKNTGSGNCGTVTGNVSLWIRDLQITHSTSSTGIGITAAGTTSAIYLDNVAINGHATALSMGTGGGLVNQSSMTTSAASTAAALISSGQAMVIGGDFTTTVGIGVQVSAGTTKMYGSRVIPAAGGITGVDVAASANLYAHGVTNTGALALGLRTAATSGVIQQTQCDWTSVTDGRTGSPVAYTFAGNGNFTPLPLQTDTIRVTVTAAATVTINAAAAMGFGRKFSLMLCRSTAGAVTWTFNAQYVLQGAAAPAPANGSMMISVFEYDPISSVYRETSRSASMLV